MSGLPRGYLSPSQANSWEMCQVRWASIYAEGNTFAPSRGLEVNKERHKVTLEDDLGYKIKTGHNRADSELSEIYRADIESLLPVLREDPTPLEGSLEKFVQDEIAYHDKILAETKPFRQKVVPVEVEGGGKNIEFLFGGVPISVRPDLVSDEGINHRLHDLKHEGQSSPVGLARTNRQLITGAAAKGLEDVGLIRVVENKNPTLQLDPPPDKLSEGHVAPMEFERIKRQYQAIESEILHAMQTGIFKPVDKGNKRTAWVCSRAWCGVWASDAKDMRTGANISCQWGERSGSSVSLSTSGVPAASRKQHFLDGAFEKSVGGGK